MRTWRSSSLRRPSLRVMALFFQAIQEPLQHLVELSGDLQHYVMARAVDLFQPAAADLGLEVLGVFDGGHHVFGAADNKGGGGDALDPVHDVELVAGPIVSLDNHPGHLQAEALYLLPQLGRRQGPKGGLQHEVNGLFVIALEGLKYLGIDPQTGTCAYEY